MRVLRLTDNPSSLFCSFSMKIFLWKIDCLVRRERFDLQRECVHGRESEKMLPVSFFCPHGFIPFRALVVFPEYYLESSNDSSYRYYTYIPR